jgi:hypothetical protein
MSDRAAGPLVWALIGAVAGALLATWLAVAVVMLFPPLHIRVGINHGLFLLIVIAVPVVAGVTAGWFFAGNLSRRKAGRWILDRWRRYWAGSWPIDWRRLR